LAHGPQIVKQTTTVTHFDVGEIHYDQPSLASGASSQQSSARLHRRETYTLPASTQSKSSIVGLLENTHQSHLQEMEKRYQAELKLKDVEISALRVEVCAAKSLKDEVARQEEIKQSAIAEKEKSLQEKLEKATQILASQIASFEESESIWKNRLKERENHIKEIVEAHKIEKTALLSTIEKVTLEVNQVEKQKAALQNKLEEIEQEDALNGKNTERLNSHIKTLKKQISDIQNLHSEENESAKKSITELKQKLQQLEKEKEHANIEVNTSRSMIPILQSQIQAYQEEIKRIQTTPNQELAKLKLSNQTLEVELKSLRSTLAQKDKELELSEHKLQELIYVKASNLSAESSAAEKNSQIETLKHSLSESTDRIQRLEKKIQEFSHEASIIQQDRLSLESKLQSTSQELSKMTRQVVPKLQDHIEQLNEELDSKCRENEELHEVVYRLESEINDTAAALKSLENELMAKIESEVDKATKNLQETNENQGMRIEQLELEQASSQAIIKQLEDKANYLQTARSAQKDESSKKQREDARREEELETLSAEIISLNAKIEEGQVMLRTKENELIQLATFCKSLQSELMTLRPLSRNVKLITQENQSLMESLKKIEAEFEEYKREVEVKEVLLVEERDRVVKLNKDIRENSKQLAEKNTQLVSRLAVNYAELDRQSQNNTSQYQSNNSHQEGAMSFAASRGEEAYYSSVGSRKVRSPSGSCGQNSRSKR